MNLNKNLILLIFTLFLCVNLYAQEKNVLVDSTQVQELEEVVLTGQHSPQSVKQSVFEVQVINSKTIEQQAANNLADLLNQTLNINITPNVSTGKSGVSLFGLGARYFKVLIDNIPVINEEGFGNNTDLTLINLDDIEQIEIVEGAMGVQYGANALSGIINIITKKSSRYKTELKAHIQEETIGEEYEWFDKGRHIQSVQVRHNLTDYIFGSVAYTRNDFGGLWNGKKGAIYDKNDSLRGHVWLPKLQHTAKALLSYNKNEFSAFYKFDYFKETLSKYDSIVDLNENPATDTSSPSAFDELYFNNRFYHHLNINGLVLKRMYYDVSLSYQKQTKDIEQYTYRIRTDEKENVNSGEYLWRSAFFSRGTLSNIVQSDAFSLQLGYELTNEKGYGSPLTVMVSPDDNAVSQRLDNYDVFSSIELKLSDRLSLRPGARISFSNLFKNQYIFSLSSKYDFSNDWELRTILGSANSTPNYDELYTYFVDVNHNVQGNPNLVPERGVSAFVHLKKHFSFKNNKLQLKQKLSMSYMGLRDRIELIVVEQSPLAYQYNNIDSFKSIGLELNNSLRYQRLKGQLGISVLGISKILDSSSLNAKDDFLYSLRFNSSVSYSVPDWNSAFALYFKHNGKQHQFVEKTNEADEQEYVKGVTGAFSWLNATVKKSFNNKAFEVVFGVRNILDVTTVGTTALSGGAHSEAPSNQFLAYGRSYVLKLAYNLKL